MSEEFLSEEEEEGKEKTSLLFSNMKTVDFVNLRSCKTVYP